METVGPAHIPPTGPQGPEGDHDVTHTLSLPDQLPKSGNAPTLRGQPQGLLEGDFFKIQAYILAGLLHD